MGETSGVNRRLSIGRVIRPIIFDLTGIAITIVLLSPGGIIFRFEDLGFLLLPILGFFILHILSRLSTVFIPSVSGVALAYVFNATAFSFFFLLFMRRVVLFSDDSTQLQFLYQIKNAAPFVIPIIIGYTGIKLINLTNELPRFKNIRAGSIALSQILPGLGVWLSFNSFTNTYINKIGLIFFSGMAVLAVCSLAAYGGKSKIFVISQASRWLNQSYSSKFIITVILAIYIIFIHPLVMSISSYFTVLEWAIICIIAWRILSSVRSSIRAYQTEESKDREWQRHIQQIRQIVDTDFHYLDSIQTHFLEDGNRVALVIYLTILLKNNNISQDSIITVLQPLINYRDREISWFSFPWEQKQILKQNRRNRQLQLDEITLLLKTFAEPLYKKMKEYPDDRTKST